MLDPRAHGKGLRLHGNTLLIQHFKGVPRAVTDGKDDAVGIVATVAHYADDLSVFKGYNSFSEIINQISIVS